MASRASSRLLDGLAPVINRKKLGEFPQISDTPVNMDQFSITFPDDRRFDDRLLRSEDDGADFETFVFEIFAVADADGVLSPLLARGRDGAIDLMSDGVTRRCVVEAKFIGKDTADTA